MKKRHENFPKLRTFISFAVFIFLLSPNLGWAEDYDVMPLDAPGIRAGEDQYEWIKLAYSEDPAQLAKEVFKLTDEDIANYHKLLADRGLKFGDLVDKSKAEKVKDLFPDFIVDHLLMQGWNFYVRETESFSPPRRWLAATKMYHKNVKIKQDHNLEGYVGGTPFPLGPKEDDPDAGYKVMWNLFYRPLGDLWDLRWALYWIDGKKGVDRTQDWMAWVRASETRLFSGNIIPNRDVEGSRAIFHVGGLAPFDIEGMWTLQYKKNNGSYDDYWAYIPGSRRVRRASSSANKDVFAGSDMINDDAMFGYSGQIAWLEKVKYIDKKVMFGHAHGERAHLEVDMNEKYTCPYIDTKNPPHWLLNNDTWELRPFWVVEATYGRDYPYGRRVLYVDCEHNWLNYQSCYDQKGELWKFLQVGQNAYSKKNSPWFKKYFNEEIKMPLEYSGVFQEGFCHGSFQLVIDVQMNHGTYFPVTAYHPYSEQVNTEDLTLSALQRKSS